MAVLKLSQIATTVSAVASGDFLVAVQGGTTDVLFTATQIKTWTSASPTLVTPTLGVATGTSLALGGATIGSNALAVTGTSLFNSAVTIAAGTTLNWGTNVALVDDAAGILAQRNSTTAQTHRVYNTFTDASNYERGVFDWTTTPNTLTIGTQNAGTGTLRDTTITGSHINFITNSIDGIGNIQNNNSAGYSSFQTNNNAGAQRFSFGSGNTTGDMVANRGYVFANNSDLFVLSSTGKVNVVQYAGAAANSVYIYNTLDAAGAITNYERLALDWTTVANTAIIDAQAGGTGTQRVISLRHLDSSTGGGTATFASTNCPAVTLTSVFTWIKVISSDGSTVYLPAWK